MANPWVVIAASRAGGPAGARALAGAIEAEGGLPGEGRSLSASGPVYAGCYPFNMPDDAAPAGLRARLEAELEADIAVMPAARFGRKRLLICDMDSTIIGQECIDELADAVGLKPQISEITERAMRGELDFEAALTSRVAMLRGLPLGELDRTLRERITLNPGARTMIATMKAHGAQTLLVSGGFTFFTSRVAKLAGFNADQGNTLIDDGAALTGEVGQPILGRAAKLTALLDAAAALGAGPQDAVALGDGANDLDMIKAAGLGIAYYAKPVVAAEAGAAIRHTDLTAALFFQGFTAAEFVHG
ncbi:MAG: phosphoserine phosphatase SerB [Hyphomonas sp.]|uniref:phosphoserine phosphatase SerB n=1 Tax=Hyphomonas sp. TaxID=87 RepID=UPI0034A09378